MRKLLGIIIALAAIAVSTSAEARGHRRHQQAYHRHHSQIVARQAAPFSIFGGQLNSDVADYGSSARVHLAIRIERIERTSRRHIVLSTGHEATRIERTPERTYTSANVGSYESAGSSRPGDCYGIAWCGCFMRHYTGLADKSLNLARNWAGVGGQGSRSAGDIVVWNHHVGVLQSEIDSRGYAMVLSGNNGSGNRATVRRNYVGNAIAFRRL